MPAKMPCSRSTASERSRGAAATASVANPVAVAVIHARPGTAVRSARAYTGSDRPNVTNPAVISPRVSEPTAANRLMASSIEEYCDEVAAAPMTHAPMNPAGPITPARAAVRTGSRMPTT